MKKRNLFLILTLGFFGVINTNAQSWTQQGSDIDGEAAGDYSGVSVSLSSDGSTVAIGAWLNDGNGSYAGHVRIYKNISGTWTQQGSDIDGEAAGDQSGGSVSLSSDGSTVAIGAYRNDGNGTNAGHVRIYKNISGTWTQQGSDIDGEAAYDQSGYSVSLSSDGSTVAIGASYNDGNGTNAGHVRIYKNISGTWTQQGSDIDGEAAGDLSGGSVSLSSDGSTVAIGAYANDGNGTNAGHVRIYKNISGTWTQQGSDIDGEAAGDYSGGSVSQSSDGSTVAIGAYRNDGNGTNAGHVRIYKNISGTWTQQGSDIDGEAADDNSGLSVSLSSDGSTVAIGAYGNDGNGSNAGHVRIYKDSSGTWTQQGSDIDGEAASDQSGYSVSLSSDGSTVAIGAYGNDGNGSNAGHLSVYSLCITTYSKDTITSCVPYTWTDGITYTSSNNTATDTFVNAAGCDSIVTLSLTIDIIRPTVVTQNLTVSLDASGVGSVTATQVDNGSTDNCTIITRTLSKSSFDCSEVGLNTIYLIVTDVNGNVDSASAVITVQDVIKPTVVTQNVTVSLDASGSGSITVADVDNGSTDNCTIATRTLSKSSFDCSEVGSNTIYLIVTDVNGNVDSASAVITVQDVIKPTVVTQNVTVSLDASGAGSVTATQVDKGSTDNCTIATRTLSQSSFDCSEVGSNTIYLIVTDVNGNVDSASAVITVQDVIKPTVVTQNVTVSLDASGSGSITVADVDNGSTDNCTIATRTLSQSSFDCSEVGANTVYLIVTDVNGNVDSAIAVITVQDVIKPTVVTQNVTVSVDASGVGSVTATQVDNGSTDNCTIATRALSKSSFDCSELGTNTIWLRVTDVNGNVDSASAVITVKDTVITQNLTVSLDASGSVSVTATQLDKGSTDNCTISTRTLSKSSFDCSEVGSNTIYLIVTDVNGNVDSASAVITVQDTIKPTVVTQNGTVSLDASGSGSITVADVDNGSTDNCTIATRTLSQSSFDCSEVGSNTIYLIVTDVSGNVDSASAVITVQDTIRPTIVTQNLTVSLDASGSGSITVADVDNGSTDNCTIATRTLSKSSFDCSEVGANTVYLIVTDVNGNVDSASAVITVQDVIRPTVLTQAVTVSLDASGSGSITVADVDNGSTDNCTIATRTLSKSSFDCSEVGSNTIYLIVTDVNGNVDSASAVITVQDVIKPTVVTQNVTVSLDASGAGSVTATQVDKGSTDNCTIATRTLSQSSFDCSEVGSNTIYLIVTDVNGNVDSASAVITVQDVIKPTVVTQNVTVSLDASGSGSITVADVDNGSTDNCTIATRTLSQSSFDCSEVGANTVYLIVTDVNGNVDSASAVITVQDVINQR